MSYNATHISKVLNIKTLVFKMDKLKMVIIKFNNVKV